MSAPKRKVIARIRGGLGNQLFCYAAARRLALVSDAELVLDDVTGFARDRLYRREYALHRFRIPARLATPGERLEPLERYRRAALKWLSRGRPWEERRYVEAEHIAFDQRLVDLRARRTVYLDGLWQSERYFRDVEPQIRSDLEIVPPEDAANREAAEAIRRSLAVAVHVRWFGKPAEAGAHNLPFGYYRRAISGMEALLGQPRYFLFSDDPQACLDHIDLPRERLTVVAHNRGGQDAYADLWLMAQCRHFITANSTFSWWGAWLGREPEKIVMTPDFKVDGLTAWGFPGLVPDGWTLVPVD